jgi:short-chain fatty acids transporter
MAWITVISSPAFTSRLCLGSGGLSSSIPLLLNTPGNFLIEGGYLTATVPIGMTLGSSLNFFWLAAYFVLCPILIVTLAPSAERSEGIEARATDASLSSDLSVAEEAARPLATKLSPSDRMNHSNLLSLIVSAAGLTYIAWYFSTRGFDLNLNIMIFVFVIFGMLAHRTPLRYVVAMKRACSNISGIIFQYPFYAGIMGMMQFTGLGEAIAAWMAAGASVTTLPLIGQATGAIVNFAIPSAGGEWAVLGPTFIEAARELASDMSPDQFNAFISRVALAVAYGESSTNALQPFYLLIILPVMGAGVNLQARDIMGYLVLPFLVMHFLTALIVTFAPV